MAENIPGKNTLLLNQEAMKRAMEYYLTNAVFEKAVKVACVTMPNDSAEFQVTIEPCEQ